MIPDGRVSRIRFEAAARRFSLLCAFLQFLKLKLWSAFTREPEVRFTRLLQGWAAVFSRFHPEPC
jgi:hypothetical protein